MQKMDIIIMPLIEQANQCAQAVHQHVSNSFSCAAEWATYGALVGLLPLVLGVLRNQEPPKHALRINPIDATLVAVPLGVITGATLGFAVSFFSGRC